MDKERKEGNYGDHSAEIRISSVAGYGFYRCAMGNCDDCLCLEHAGTWGPSQRLFSSPEDALKALVEAVKAKDKAMLDQILGPSGKDLRSGDKVEDVAEFDELATHLAEKSAL